MIGSITPRFLTYKIVSDYEEALIQEENYTKRRVYAMFELVFLTLTILFFLGNMVTIGVPFVLMEWLDKRMAEWKAVAI